MAIIGQGIINAGALTGGVGTIDAATLQGHPASYFTPMSTTAVISGAVTNLQQQMSGVQNLTSRVVFKEAFTGNGITNTFNLNGTVLNAAFATGAWGSGYIVLTMTAYITDLNGNVIYDSIIPVYRDKIQVTSVDSSGLVTTDFIPLAGQQGYIWYWYQLTTTDVLSYYYREDFVTYAESEAGTDVATAVYVGPTPFSNVVVKITDVTVDDALHAIDNYVAAMSGAGTGSIGGSIEVNQVAFGVDTNTVAGISGFTYDGYTLSVINGGTLPPILPSLGFQVADKINTYLQINVQNLSDGDEASTDIVVTNDTGDDNDNWFDFGINGSLFNQPYWTVNGSSDAYLYANNANVAIGTASVGKQIVIFTGGTQDTNIRAKFTDSKIEFTPASSIVPGDTGFIFTGAINTGIATGTESHDILFNLNRIVTWEQGNVLEQSAVHINNPTYAGEGPTTNTFTDASTVTIEGPPVAGANAIITNPKALWIKSGVVQVDGNITAQSIFVNGDEVATLSTVAAISGDLQTQIDNIAQPNHNDMLGIQGGIANEYYHLTASEYANISGAGAVNTSVQLPWKYENSTVSSDPGSTKFRLNNLTVASATALYISRNSNNGIDGYNIFNNLDVGDKIYLQRSDDASEAILVTISGTLTDNTTWFSIPITVDSAATSPTFTNNKVFSFVLINYTNLNSYVPYNGATADVNLGIYKMTVDAITVNSISGSGGNIVTHDGSGKLLDSGILASSLTPLTTTASISGNFQAQINGKAPTAHTHTSLDVTDFSEAVDDRVYGLLVAGQNISFTYNDPLNTLTINSTSAAGISGSALLQGIQECDTINSVYTISHPNVDPNYSNPTISLLVPMSGSNLFVQGITNVQNNSFQVVLSEVPNVAGYKIFWHLPSTSAAILGTAVVNQQMTTLPSVTVEISGSYNVTFTDTVVYATSDVVVYLPVAPSPNEHHWIVNLDGGDVQVNGNGKNIWIGGVANAFGIIPSDSSIHLHYNQIKDRWYII